MTNFFEAIPSNKLVSGKEISDILADSDLPEYLPGHIGHESPSSNAGKMLYALGRSEGIKTGLVCFAGPPGPNGLFCLSKGFNNKNGRVFALEGRRRYAFLNWLFLFKHKLTKSVTIHFRRIELPKDKTWFDKHIDVPTIDLFAVDIDDSGSENLYQFIISKYKPKLIFVENSGYKPNDNSLETIEYDYEDEELFKKSMENTGQYRLLISRCDSKLKVPGRKFSLYIKKEYFIG
jgi:hypothetical protein